MHRVLEGALAGAVGVTVINAATNLDMVIRGRPASSVPKDVVAELAHDLGVVRPATELGDDPDESRSNRFSGAGALMGTLTGVCGGIAYAVAAERIPSVPMPLAALALGAGTMAVTDTSAAVTGAAEPSSWGAASWAADVVPHLLYGLATAAVLGVMHRSSGARSRVG